MGKLIPPPAWKGQDKPQADFPNWAKLLKHTRVLPHSADIAQPKVLMATHTGLHGGVVTLDSTIAASLKLRGTQVHYSLCDGILQGCLMANIGDVLTPEKLVARGLLNSHCKGCINRGSGAYAGLDLQGHRLSEYLTSDDYANAQEWAESFDSDDAPQATLAGIPIGEHAYAGALRFFASGTLSQEPLGHQVLTRYLEGGVLMFHAFSRLLDAIQPDVVVLHHGIYSPQGIAAQIATSRGIRVVTWVVAYRKSTFIFSHDDTYHHTMMDEPVTQWENLALDDGQHEELLDYLQSRSDGSQDWIYFHKDPDHSIAKYAEATGIRLDRPIISLLTNVMWDAQLHYPQNAFPTMLDWILDSIRELGGRDDLQVLIRVHPAEARGAIPARQTVMQEVAKHFETLPSNVFLIGPEDDVSTYDLASASNAIIIFGTKMGVELTPMGRPVIVAGEAWIRNKGLTSDVASRSEYAELLKTLPLKPGQGVANRDRALKYAYHFFFRRMIPLPFIQPSGKSSYFSVDIKSADELAPGRHRGLDVICDGILNGEPFIYPAEEQT